MRVKILGRYWSIEFCTKKELKGCKGLCDNPLTANKKIQIQKTLKGEIELDTIIHELLHAGDFSKDEEWVNQFATDIARTLWKLGYRRNA